MSDASTNSVGRSRLVKYLRNLPKDVRMNLKTTKAEGKKMRARPDWLWHALLVSFSTMGNSRGWAALKADPENQKNLSYESLARLTPPKRRQALETGLRRAKVRMPGKKADWLAQNFELINEMGGVSQASEIAFSQPGRAAKIDFLNRFYGIGDKYSRNIWMDIYARLPQRDRDRRAHQESICGSRCFVCALR